MRILVASAMWLSLACSAEAPRAPVPPASPAAPASTPVQVLQNSVSSAGQLPADTTEVAAVPPADTTQVATADTTEEAAIRTAEGRVSRVSGELRIQLIGGRTAVYKPDGYGDMWHRYQEYLKTMRSHLIHLWGMEGSGVHLVVDDSTGDTTAMLSGPPVFSPDGTRFAVTSMQGDAGYDANEIEVWRVVPRKPEREFTFEPTDYEPSHTVWRDSVTVDFIKNTYVAQGQPHRQTPGRLRRIGGKWVLTDP